jgi:hypothetical protein
MSNLMPLNEVMGSMNVYNGEVAVVNYCSVPGRTNYSLVIRHSNFKTWLRSEWLVKRLASSDFLLILILVFFLM